jgi:hypothetical protein
MSDPICATYAAGTISLATGSPINGFNNDSVAPGQPNGYINSFPNLTVGSFNNAWTNGDLTQSVQPVYRNGLLSFGNTGLQS